MSLFHDGDRAEKCLARLRSSFPLARVLVRSDGDADPAYALYAQHYHLDYTAESRLFPVVNGAAIVQRMLEMFLIRPTRYLFKIDPDTAVHRPFRMLPATPCLFGSLQGPPGCRSVQGGCLGLTEESATVIARSNLLADPDFCDPGNRVNPTGHWQVLAARARRIGLTSFDWSLGWAAEQLGIPMLDFPEVHSTWKRAVANADLRYAITHPDRDAP